MKRSAILHQNGNHKRTMLMVFGGWEPTSLKKQAIPTNTLTTSLMITSSYSWPEF